MRRILLLLSAAAMMAVMLAVSAGPASADDWGGWKKDGWDRWDKPHGKFWHGCWEWSWVFERWKWDCDHKDFDKDRHKDFDKDRHKDFDKDRHKDRDKKKWWDWRD
jgi:hypothetical protein